MKIDDIFEGSVPVMAVWRKRGDQIERGHYNRFIPNPKTLNKIKVTDREEQEQKQEEKDQS